MVAVCAFYINKRRSKYVIKKVLNIKTYPYENKALFSSFVSFDIENVGTNNRFTYLLQKR